MALQDVLTRPPARGVTGLPCSVGALRTTLPVAEADALDRMLGVLGWTAPQIHAAITSEGHTVALTSINKHRRGHCRCSR